MISNHHRKFNRVTLLGVDGSGKSTTSQEVAANLSREYPERNVFIADSDGIALYDDGEVVDRKFTRLDSLEPTEYDSKVKRLAKIGSFTLLRRFSEQVFTHKKDSFVIGVRDPFRIDPAIYAGVFGPDNLKATRPESRLRFFNAFTTARHPDAVVMLSADEELLRRNIYSREVVSYHESQENTAHAARELPRVLAAYTRLYGTPWHQVEGLQPTTTDIVTEKFEEYLVRESA